MSTYPRGYTTVESNVQRQREQAIVSAYVTKVYGWMALALGITAIVAMFTYTNVGPRAMIASRGLWWGLILAELGLVMGISWMIDRISAITATVLFVIYSALNGVTFSVLFAVYTSASIFSTFFLTAGMFGAMALYGHVTKRDLTTIGNLCFMGLIGLILASIVNVFVFGSQMLYWATTYLGILIFVGLTAYDAQKVKTMAFASVDADAETVQKGAIMGALALYLDFINLFLYLLRLFGRRR